MLFIAAFFSKLIFSIFVDDVSYAGISLGIVFTIFFLIYYRRMDDEL